VGARFSYQEIERTALECPSSLRIRLPGNRFHIESAPMCIYYSANVYLFTTAPMCIYYKCC
jgi:hypothetical protein